MILSSCQPSVALSTPVVVADDAKGYLHNGPNISCLEFDAGCGIKSMEASFHLFRDPVTQCTQALMSTTIISALTSAQASTLAQQKPHHSISISITYNEPIATNRNMLDRQGVVFRTHTRRSSGTDLASVHS